MSACRSCGAPIIWAITENGKRMPLDAEPAERPTGVFRLEPSGDDLIARRPIEQVYISHFATCPNADQHRKPKPSPEEEAWRELDERLPTVEDFERAFRRDHG